MECYSDHHPKELKDFVCSKKDENQFFLFRVLLDGHFEHPLFIHFNSILYNFFPYDLYANLLSTKWHLGPNIPKKLEVLKILSQN
jgi:hypothetical protein